MSFKILIMVDCKSVARIRINVTMSVVCNEDRDMQIVYWKFEIISTLRLKKRKE
jgi:hypothetical protein